MNYIKTKRTRMSRSVQEWVPVPVLTQNHKRKEEKLKEQNY